MIKNKEKGFTLMELLAVVVILGITFLFIMPSVTSLMGLGERREIELIEERVLSAAKEYVNNYDSTFYNSFYKEGDTNYVYKSDLINAGLIDKNEISKLNTFAGVKGELLKNDKIRYTVEYINTSNNEYTNEELYLMMQNLTKDVQQLKNQSGSSGSGDTSSTILEELQTQINENKSTIANLTNKDNTNNIFLQTYPVGSIYVTNDSANPGTKFGGTWVTYGEGRTLVGVDSSQTEFASVGLTGGEKTHLLTIDEMPSHSHTGETNNDGAHLHNSTALGWIVNDVYSNMMSQPNYTDSSGFGTDIMINSSGSNHSHSFSTNSSGNGKTHNNLQPYITVYIWKRTA